MPKSEGWVPEPYPMEENKTEDLPSSLTGNMDTHKSGTKEDGEKKITAEAEGEKPEAQLSPDDLEKTVFEDTTPAEKAISLCANIISWIFVPLMMPVYGIILIFTLSILSFNPLHTRITYMLIVFGINFVLPMLAVILMKKMGIIQDVGLNGRRERVIPYIISILCLAGTGLFLWYKSAPMWVAMFYAGGALAALVNLIVNFKWKISAHAAGIAGLVAMLIEITKDGFPMQNMTIWIVGAILIAGLLGSARIWLGRHTLLQVLAGSAVGFICVWGLSMI